MKILVRGRGSSPGIAMGRAKIVFSPEEAGKKIRNGNILVTSMTNPDFTPFMKKAAAIITNSGGVLSHAAIVAREFGIPCVTGTENATRKLKDGMKVIVDGSKGIVYKAR